MNRYEAPLRDIRFALFDVIGAEALYARLGFTGAIASHTDTVTSA